jgi:hypothetical protein
MPGEVRDGFKSLIGDNIDVLPALEQRRYQHNAVENAGRVIRCNQKGTTLRDMSGALTE